jgi:hypothetical protein
MRYYLIFIFLFTWVYTNAQQTETREIQSFDKIEVTGNIKVEMKLGESETLKIKTLNVDPSEVVTVVKNKLLKIKMGSNLFDDNAQVTIYLTFKEIREITSNAGAEVKIQDQIEGDKIFASATSGGRILMNVNLNAIEIKVYQGAHIDVSGNCKTQESFISTGGVLSASNFECDEVFIKMNAKAQAEIIANKKIVANVKSGASLSYFGKPEEESLKTSLGGSISKWDENK